MEKDNVPIEEAINRAGFGLYSYLMTIMAGVAILSFACIGYSSTIIVPTSACELQTTAAQQGVLAAAPVVGSIIGSVIWGYLADTRGRRSMLLVSLLGAALVNALSSLSVNWIMLMLVQFCACLFASGLFSMAMSILSESVPMLRRNLVVLLVSSIFMLAQGVMAVLAIPIIPLSFSYYLPALDIYWNSWRTLLVVYSVPTIITAIWLFFMQESPKFVYSQGDTKQALEILKVIHRINHLGTGKVLEVNSILKEEVKMTEQGTAEKRSQIVPLFKAPLLKYTIIVTMLFMFQQIGSFLVWLPTVANQFMQILETGEGSDLALCDIIHAGIDTPEDPDAVPCSLNITAMLIVLGVGASQSIINILLSTIVNKVGRRNIVIGITSICGVAGILVNLIPNAVGSAVVFGIMLQGIIVVGMYTAICVALFPTHLRALAIALPLMGGRIATFASIQILNLMLNNNCEASFYLFGSLFASSALLVLLLPDDRKLQAPAPPSATTIEANGEKPKEIYRNTTQL